MPPRGWQLRIEDILEAIGKIQRYIRGMDYEKFSEDEKSVDAVIRNFTVIGEAARRISDDYTEAHPDLPWEEMRGIRNIVVHEYFGVSLPILWETATRDLPPLVPQLEKLLQREKRKDS